MALINIPAFSGLNILAAPQRIRDDEATVAIGCDFRSLDLRAFHDDKDSGMGATAYASSINANGASIFQLDQRWIGALGDKNFARSPTFFSDGTTGQRLFVTDNGSPVGNEWDWVQEVNVNTDLTSTGNTNSYLISSTSRRLGVPKPAAINMDKVDYERKNGRIESLKRFTNDDTLLELDSASQDYLKPGDKIVLDVPGIGTGPYTVAKKSTASPPAFTLRNCRLAYVDIDIIKSTQSTEIKFKKTNHGLVGGEQVVLNRKANSDTNLIGKLPTSAPVYNQTVYEVAYVDVDHFKLLYGAAGTELALTSSETSGVTTTPMKYALVAASDDSIPTPWDVAHVIVNTLSNYQQQVTYYGIPTDVTSTWEIAEETLIERAYCVTFVNAYGDESEPSEPTKVIAVAQGDPVTFTQKTSSPATTTQALPTAAASYSGDLSGITLDKYRTPSEIRLYRTDSTGVFRLVTTGVDADRIITWAEAGTTDFSFVDSYEDTELGEPLSTQGWQIPPKDLNGILISPGGSLVGYKDRGVLGSVPYAPYAFPIGNRVAFDYNVKGLVATSSGIVVVTDGMPALIVGDDPATWSIQKLEYPYGCVSRRSIVDLGEMAIYASADGLVGIAGANVEILTKDTIKREDWQSLYNPANIIAAHAEGRYYAITQLGDGTRKAFMFDPRTRSFINLTVGTPYPIALYSRLTDDTLLILKSDGKVYEWNRGTNWVDYTWQSKWFQLTRPDILGCGQILSPALIANYNMTMTLYGWDGENVVQICKYTTGTADPANKVYKFDKNVNPFRLPVPPDRYTVYTVKLEGSLPIGQVSLASTMDEIKQV